MDAFIGVVIGSILTGIITWTTTKQRTVTDLINVDKQVESSYRLQRAQLEATAKTTQQQIHAQVVLAERMKWIATLRDSLAEFVGSVPLGLVLSKSEEPGSEEKLRALLSSQAVVACKIILLLNPDEDDHTELHQRVTTAALAQFGDDETQAANAAVQLVGLTEIARKILKREWERVKKGK